MNIARLPGTTLAQVFSYLDGIDLLKMWLLGCSLLNTKLSSNGIHMHLDCPQFWSSLRSGFRFPRYVSYFAHLASISLQLVQNEVIDEESTTSTQVRVTEGAKAPEKLARGAEAFSSLPRSLTALYSHTYLDYVYFMEAYLSDEALFPNLKSLDLGGCVSLTPTTKQAWPTTLTSLKLSADRTCVINGWNALQLEAESLPRALTRLDCDGISMKPYALPPSVIVFSFKNGPCPLNIVDHLPTGLVKLTLKTTGEAGKFDWDFSRFPPSLEYLSLSLLPDPIDDSFFRAMKQANQLKRLKLDQGLMNLSSLLSSLPPRLESFGYRTSLPETFLGMANLDLPKTLTAINVPLGMISWEDFPHLPAPIVYVLASFGGMSKGDRSREILEQLTRQCERFTQLHTMIVFGESSRASLAALPPTLTSASFIHSSFGGTEIEALRTTRLQTLAINSKSINLTIGSPFLQALPATLTRLSVGRCSLLPTNSMLDDSIASKCTFPESLTDLMLHHISGGGSSWLKHIPMGLKVLSLEWDLKEKAHFWELRDAKSICPPLPPALMRLSLCMSMHNREELTGILQSIRNLKVLKELKLRDLGRSQQPGASSSLQENQNSEIKPIFEDQDLTLLPLSMKRIQLDVRHTLTTASIAFLPLRCCLQLDFKL